MKRWISWLGVALTLVGLAACSGDDAEQVNDGAPLVAEGRKVLRKGNGTEPQTLDSQRAQDVSSSHILRDLYEGLVLTGPDAEPAPGVASRWEVTADGLSWTLHLRPEARWSNGDAVTAGDFVAGMRRAVDPAVGSQYGMILAPIRNASAVIAGKMPVDKFGVVALDDHTLRIDLEAPTPYLLSLLTHSTSNPIHQPSLATHGERFTRPGNLVSNGAYQLVDWVVNSQIVLRRNEHYWDAAHVDIDEVRYYPIEDSSAELKRYRAAELDWTGGVPSNQFRWAKEKFGDQLKVNPYLGTYFYGFNLTRAPFKDAPGLRRSLSLAVDREILVQHVTASGEIPAYGWVPPGLPGYQGARADYADWPREQRLAEAKRLYHEAGYGPNNPLVIELRYNTQEDHRKIAVAIAQMWKQVLGVQVLLLNEEWKVFLQNRQQKKVTQVYRAGWVGDYTDPYTFMELMRGSYGLNDTGYNRPEYDALLDRAAQLSAGDERNQLMVQAEAMMLADLPVMPLYYYVSKSLIKPWVKGYDHNLMNHNYSKNLSIAVDAAP